MRTSTEFISYISASTISTSFDFHDLVKGRFSDVYRFMSRHICRSLYAFLSPSLINCYTSPSKLACSAGVFFFKARDRKFAAILTWEKWVGRGWGKMDENACPFPRNFSFRPNSHSLGCIFVSPQASSEFESKMALA